MQDDEDASATKKDLARVETALRQEMAEQEARLSEQLRDADGDSKGFPALARIDSHSISQA